MSHKHTAWTISSGPIKIYCLRETQFHPELFLNYHRAVLPIQPIVFHKILGNICLNTFLPLKSSNEPLSIHLFNKYPQTSLTSFVLRVWAPLAANCN